MQIYVVERYEAERGRKGREGLHLHVMKIGVDAPYEVDLAAFDPRGF